MRLALDLASAVRDQYAHQAHTIIIGNDSHLGYYAEAKARVLVLIKDLRGRAERPDERAWVDDIEAGAADLDGIFSRQIVPAVLAGRTADAHVEHARALAVVSRIQQRTDLLAKRFEDAIGELQAFAQATRDRTLGLERVLPGARAPSGRGRGRLSGPQGGAAGGASACGRRTAGRRRPRHAHRGWRPRRVRRPGPPVQHHGRVAQGTAASPLAERTPGGSGSPGRRRGTRDQQSAGRDPGIHALAAQEGGRGRWPTIWQIVEEEVLHCQEIVEGLLDFSRPVQVGTQPRCPARALR
jgi:hypothetical protein